MTERPQPEANPFAPRLARWLIGLTIASVLAGIALLFWWDPDAARKQPGTNSFSRSAVGHYAFHALLNALELRVDRGRMRSVLDGEGLVIVAEPSATVGSEGDEASSPNGSADEGEADPEPGLAFHRDRSRLLVVLPKWDYEAHSLDPTRVSGVTIQPSDEVEELLTGLGIRASVTRPTTTTGWQTDLANDDESIRIPVLSTAQLLESSFYLESIVSCDEGVLLAKIRGREQWILSDPDLINNHGLKHPENAELAVRIVEALRHPSAPTILDETVHGFELDPSLWRLLRQPPLIFVTVQIALWLLLAIWSGLSRFALPIREVAFGRHGHELLFRNTAELLEYTGKGCFAVRSYFEHALDTVARGSQVATPTVNLELCEDLDRRGRSERSAVELWNRAVENTPKDPTTTLRLAEAIRHWKEDMLDVAR